MSKRWGWVLAFGILLVLAAFVALGSVVTATLATVFVLGMVLLGSGILEIILAFEARGWRGTALHVTVGFLTAIVGGLMLAQPGLAAKALTIFLAAVLLTGGCARIAMSVVDRYQGWGWDTFSGAMSVLLGGFIFAHWPTSAMWFLGMVVGIELLFRGFMWISLAFTARDLHARTYPTIPEARRTT